MYIDATRIGNEIWCWERDENGQLHTIVDPAPYYCYMPSATPDAETIFGDGVKKVVFDDFKKMKDFTKNRDNLYESDISPVYKYLSEFYYGTKTETPVNILFFDIEVDFNLNDGKGYPDPFNPFGEINAVSAFDTGQNVYHMIILDNHITKDVVIEDPDGEYEVITHRAKNEAHLLAIFEDLLKDIDILTAWNGDKFDIPYIIARASILFGENDALRMMCRDNFKAYPKQAVDDFGNEFIKYELVGRLHLDMLDVYKKFSYEVKASYSLNSVAADELKESKIEYDTNNLGDLYRNDPQTFFDYSIQDARLLKKINDKKHIIELLIMLGRQSTVRMYDVMGTVKMIEQRIINFCHYNDPDKFLVVPDKTDKFASDFAGGYVYDTIVGKHNWMGSYDLTSLYPSVMMMLGLSNETFLFQLQGRYEDYIRVVTGSDDMVIMECVAQHVDYRDMLGETYEMKAHEVMDLIRDSGFCISANGSIFSNEDGIIARVIEDGFTQRKHFKKLMKDAGKEGDKAKEGLYDLYQQACKIVINSAYGAITNAHFRFFDLDLGKTITLTGQIISKAQMIFIDQTIDETVEIMNE